MTARTNVCLLLLCCTLSLVSSACGLSISGAAAPPPTWTSTPSPILAPSPTPSPTSSATATPTPSPTSSATTTPTALAATATAVPPTPPAAQATPTFIRPVSAAPTATAGQPGACVPRARLLADLTTPAGTTLAPQAEFTKIWRIRNDGTCAWDAGYQLVYAAGDRLSGAATVAIPAVAPGQTVDISIDLIAPAEPGSYGSLWRLQAGNGTTFGRYTVFINVDN